MAINWRFKNNHSKKEQKPVKGIPFSGLGISFLVLALIVVLFDCWLYKDNFKTASLSDMANGRYREDKNYVDTCVSMFHDLVVDTFYRDGYFFASKNANETNAKKVKQRVEQLHDTRGLYTYVNQRYDSRLKLYFCGYVSDQHDIKTMRASILPGNCDFNFYNIGNAYSGRKITSYRIKEARNYGIDNSGKLGMLFYDSGESSGFMVLGKMGNSVSAISNMGSSAVKYGIVLDNTLYHYDEFGNLMNTDEEDTFEFVELNQFNIKQKKGSGLGIGSNYLYTVSDKTGKYVAEVDVSLDGGELALKEASMDKLMANEEPDNTLDFKEVWNSIFALAEFRPEKAPLLFLSYDDNMKNLLKGNECYVKRYKELYGDEYAEVFPNGYTQDISSKRYKNNKDIYALTPHATRSVTSIIQEDKKIVALFADEDFNLQYTESPLYSYEMAATVLRYSTMLVPILFLFGVCFLVIGIYRKEQKNGQSARVLAMGFLPVEMRGVVLLALGIGLIYCYTLLCEREIYGYMTPFLLAMLLLFVGSNICWWRMDRKRVFSNSWVMKLADRISELTKAYYQTHGMSFFLSKRSTRFACCELLAGVLLSVAVICKYTLRKPSFVLPLFGNTIRVSLWTLVIVFLAVVIVLVFISYLRFLSVFVEGLNGVQRQLDLMGEGDFETVVPLPKHFYGFQVEEQFEAIKNGMMNAMEGEMRSERMKIDLVANVSHDIKTPLTSIINYVDLLADSKDLPAVEADYVQVLQRKSYRLRSMIQDLFDLSKATSGNLLVELTELNFTKLIQQTMADMQEDIEKSELKFRCNLLEQVYIVSDGNRLYRVLQNLISNAINYSMEQSRVYLNLDVVDDYAVFSIKNISRDEMNFTREQVMERFFRGDQSRSSEGSGLGVAIANSFVEVCGGEFDINIDADLFCATIRFPVVINPLLNPSNQYLQH